MDPDILSLLAGLGMVCVTVISLTSMILKRRRAPEALRAADLTEIRDHLSRLEQAVDSIALETERISEGQRFTTRLLADSLRVPVPSDHGKLPAS
jgi:hypothetical protein